MTPSGEGCEGLFRVWTSGRRGPPVGEGGEGREGFSHLGRMCRFRRFLCGHTSEMGRPFTPFTLAIFRCVFNGPPVGQSPSPGFGDRITRGTGVERTGPASGCQTPGGRKYRTTGDACDRTEVTYDDH